MEIKKTATPLAMVENTKARPQKNPPDSSTTNHEDPRPTSNSSPDAVNLDRRSWFRSLVPAFGEGLVKILRASNNLQRDFHESMTTQAQDLLQKDEEKKKN